MTVIRTKANHLWLMLPYCRHAFNMPASSVGSRSGRSGAFYTVYVGLANATPGIATRTTTAMGFCKCDDGEAGRNELTVLLIEALVRGARGIPWKEPFTGPDAFIVVHPIGLHFDSPRVRLQCLQEPGTVFRHVAHALISPS
jgi:hypothetical protein